MKSPFPGMDPYLEQHWRDVHSALIIYARDQMQAFLPEELFARVEERVYVENPGSDDRNIYPDVRVVEHRAGTSATAVAVEGEIEIAESFVVHGDDEPVTETYIEIRDIGSGHRIVSVIEFLSPANKVPGPGQDQYRQKQSALHQGGVNLVEIDLVRAGEPACGIALQIPASLRGSYKAIVRRSWKPGSTQFYRLPLRARLGAIHIPLRQDDAEVTLPLQPLIDQCYRNGRYHTIDYQVEPVPPLSADDAKWADALLRAAGKRT